NSGASTPSDLTSLTLRAFKGSWLLSSTANTTPFKRKLIHVERISWSRRDGGSSASVRARLCRIRKGFGPRSHVSSVSRHDPPLLTSPPAARAERNMKG